MKMMEKIMIRAGFIVIFLIFSQKSFCGIGADLENFFNKMGTSINVTSPGVHRDQAAGYYSGGGLSLRNRARNSQIATLQLPNFKAGCGGIDMFMGGFSFIDSGELVHALKGIGSSAASYGFMLAMKTFAPSVESTMAWLQSEASKVNQWNINSCETAAGILGGVWPKLDQTRRYICSSIGSEKSLFGSWAAARQECGAGARGAATEAKKNTEEYKNILSDEFNVAWEVIKRNNYLYADKELAELCMAISGTIIAYKEGETRKVENLASKVGDDNFIKALFGGGVVEVYGCDEHNKCLKTRKKNYNIIGTKGFGSKVRETLKVLTNKAIADTELTPQEIAFIGNVRLPLYKMVNVLNAYKRSEFRLEDFTDIVCMDFIYQYITEILDVMLEEVANLRNAQVSDEQIGEFISQLQRAKAEINQKRRIAYEQVNQMLIMIETTKTYERQLENTFDAIQRGGEK